MAENQPFLDGNKRTAIASAFVFLRIDGLTAEFDSMALYDTMIGIANRTHDRSSVFAILVVYAGRMDTSFRDRRDGSSCGAARQDSFPARRPGW